MRIFRTLAMNRSYKDAITALNELQTNASVLHKIKAEKDRNREKNIPDVKRFASRAGVSLDLIDQLPIIHVSGTKGKGSTCAFCEHILFESGLKTGFFSSPHLVAVRERLRLNTRPISESLFVRYFWECYDKLLATKSDDNDSMPAYFRFLTILAFHIFISEKVDVAIVEVGIGGRYDCTNIIRHPIVVGVTSLGLDHTAFLGNTIEKIAWHKAGIFKSNVPALTSPQPEGAMQVLVDYASEIKCQLYKIRPDNIPPNTTLGIAGEIQRGNACLATSLCALFLDRTNYNSLPKDGEILRKNGYRSTSIPPTFPAILLSESFKRGLSKCRWPGRNQKIKRGDLTFYLDGAHTKESVEQCLNWFCLEADKERRDFYDAHSNYDVKRVLIFSCTGHRDAQMLLNLIANAAEFTFAVFTTTIGAISHVHRPDLTNFTVTHEQQFNRSLTAREKWLAELKHRHLLSTTSKKIARNTSASHTPFATSACTTTSSTRTSQNLALNLANTNDVLHENGPDTYGLDKTIVLPSVLDSLRYVFANRAVLSDLPESHVHIPNTDPSIAGAAHVQVLVTGSIHLVGNVLSFLDPELNE